MRNRISDDPGHRERFQGGAALKLYIKFLQSKVCEVAKQTRFGFAWKINGAPPREGWRCPGRSLIDRIAFDGHPSEYGTAICVHGFCTQPEIANEQNEPVWSSPTPRKPMASLAFQPKLPLAERQKIVMA